MRIDHIVPINKMTNKEYHTVTAVLKSNIKIVERGNIDIP